MRANTSIEDEESSHYSMFLPTLRFNTFLSAKLASMLSTKRNDLFFSSSFADSKKLEMGPKVRLLQHSIRTF